jgi:hypothetical protein
MLESAIIPGAWVNFSGDKMVQIGLSNAPDIVLYEKLNPFPIQNSHIV